ncbi:MAG: TonB-dependent receptor [Opitutaceae bacterium]|nr:TonB-dependent receptor [Opitutaceae bacterium]
MQTPSLIRLITLLFAGIATSAAVVAQAPRPSTDPTVRLSEFTVIENTDDSYVAAESITGTRVRTAIKDLTFTVNVITSEFLQDFAYFEINDLGYTSSVNNFDNGGGNVNIRGYGATSYLRNGFLRLGLVDRVNVDRIEVIKGPAAAIYGMTTPAGMVNIITKRPSERPKQSFSLATGSYQTTRADLNAAGPLSANGRTTYALSAGFHERNYETPWAMTRSKTASLAVQHKFAQRGTLLVELEWLARRTNPVGAIPFRSISNAPATARIQGLATELKYFSQNGPTSEQNREVSSLNIAYDSRLSDVWSLRIGGAAFRRHSLTFNNGNSTTFDVLTRRITGRTVSKGWINEDGAAGQVDLLAHYKLFGGRLDNKTLFTADHSQYWKYNPTKQLPAAVNNNPLNYAASLSVDNPDYRVPAFSADVFTNLNRKLVTRVDVNGGFLRQQITTLDNRLIAVAGTRVDNVTFNFWDKAAAAANPASRTTINHFHDFQFSPMVGVNYKLTRQVAFYANRSNSFSPNAQRATAGLNASETARGWDYGFKAGLFDDKLQFTLGGYYIDRTGVSATEVLPNGTTIATSAGNQNARGVELDFTWRVTSDLTLLGGYGYVNAHVVSNGRDLDSIGRRPSRLPAVTYGLALKYSLGAVVKGLAFNAGMQFTGQTFPDSTAGGINEGASSPRRGYTLSHDGRRSISLPSYTVVDLGLSYRLRPADSKFAHSLRLNVKNLADRDYIDTSKKAGDRRGFYVSYGVSH